MRKYFAITLMLFFCMNIFGQVREFHSIPTERSNQLDKMGIDDSTMLNSYESDFLNEVFKDSLKVFDLLHAVRMSVNGLRGVHFCRVEMLSSSTNHNHEDLLENIESFRYDGHIDFDEINKAYKP